MAYTETLTMTVPLEQLETAKRISRALDPDTGGYLAFERLIPVEEPTHATYSTSCTPEFKAQAQAMLADPAMLCAVVAADYAARWTQFEAPTLAECESFVAALVME
jgi:hypothetical protein